MKFYLYLFDEDKEYGPFSAEEVIEQLYEGTVQWTDAIRETDATSWTTMPEVFDLEEL